MNYYNPGFSALHYLLILGFLLFILSGFLLSKDHCLLVYIHRFGWAFFCLSISFSVVVCSCVLVSSAAQFLIIYLLFADSFLSLFLRPLVLGFFVSVS